MLPRPPTVNNIGLRFSTAYKKVRELPTTARSPSTAHRRKWSVGCPQGKGFYLPTRKRPLFAYTSGPLHCPQRLPDRPRWSKNLPTVRRLPTAANHFVPASAHSPLSAHSGNGMWAGSAYYGHGPNDVQRLLTSLSRACLQVSAGRICSQLTNTVTVPTTNLRHLDLGPSHDSNVLAGRLTVRASNRGPTHDRNRLKPTNNVAV